MRVQFVNDAELFQYVFDGRLEATCPRGHEEEAGLGNGLLAVLFFVVGALLQV